jgi:hypothetical protein
LADTGGDVDGWACCGRVAGCNSIDGTIGVEVCPDSGAVES